ncbi:hypothetical protein AVEN_202116-1 [Araneus ventricosus]|uniref:Uncharacterized protein n=1 Tax=Araneus ventricosus TaxID=182803 RepID=A0A4Y2WQP0_ARAVE|nr:hypothetical protein AVEN_39308-1 [Araneus ventricosus]GBO39774.1 hypothetical protein AVEN_89877-1 [Araneus ventricosus]GBO39775.1 hypothetical protein AVEN_138734-1 [Araneus ventricosus]GBO39777.1 hypothetical protein AVEN_202116-1 [Araneus ventricosus]
MNVNREANRVTGQIALVQISNENRQQFTSNNSNSTFRFNNTKSQQITSKGSNRTFNSAQHTSFPAHTSDETPKSSLISVGSVYIPLLSGRDVTWNYLVHFAYVLS